MLKYIFLLAIAASFLFSCSPVPTIGGKINSGNIADGVYKGIFYSWPNKAWVEVVVEGKKITVCKVIKSAGIFRSTGVEEIIPKRIIKEQSTKVDVVSGATNFSHVVMNATENALSKAIK